MTQHLKVALAQNPAELAGPRARVDWLKQTATGLRDQDIDLLILPELFLTGYNIGDRIGEWAEAQDGPFAQEIASLAKEHGLAIHYGFAERHRGTIYNSASCFSKGGAYLGGHRKLLLPPGFEADHFGRGSGCSYFEIEGFKIATLICYDAEFPEAVRKVAQDGAQLVVVPTALSMQWGVVSEKVIPTRAFENGVFVCYANQAGNENGMPYFGGSCIVAPNGEALARAGMDVTVLQATLDLGLVAKAQTRIPYLQDVQKLPW